MKRTKTTLHRGASKLTLAVNQHNHHTLYTRKLSETHQNTILPWHTGHINPRLYTHPSLLTHNSIQAHLSLSFSLCETGAKISRFYTDNWAYAQSHDLQEGTLSLQGRCGMFKTHLGSNPRWPTTPKFLI